jgi:GNAT superfamily N-acetyltransferase
MLAELTHEQLLPAGFTARPATMADLETAVSLMNAASIAQVGKAEHNFDSVKMEWSQESFNLETNTLLVFSPEGSLAGYIEIWDILAVPVSPWVWGRVHPEYEGLGIGSYLLSWAEARARQVFNRVPADARVVFRCGSVSTHEPTKQLLQNYGMMPVRYFWTMRTDLEEPLAVPMLPEGMMIKTFAEVDDLTAVVTANSEAFQDHWGYVAQPVAEMVKRWQEWLASDSNSIRHSGFWQWLATKSPACPYAAWKLIMIRHGAGSMIWRSDVPGGGRVWRWRCCTTPSAHFMLRVRKQLVWGLTPPA